MLLTFKGKGCTNCPFRGITIGDFGRRIRTCMLSYNINKCIVEDWERKLYNNLDYNEEEKPKDCPFAQFPNTLEIDAHNE